MVPTAHTKKKRKKTSYNENDKRTRQISKGKFTHCKFYHIAYISFHFNRKIFQIFLLLLFAFACNSQSLLFCAFVSMHSPNRFFFFFHISSYFFIWCVVNFVTNAIWCYFMPNFTNFLSIMDCDLYLLIVLLLICLMSNCSDHFFPFFSSHFIRRWMDVEKRQKKVCNWFTNGSWS